VVELVTVAFGVIPASAGSVAGFRGLSVKQGFVFPTLAHPNKAGVDDFTVCLTEISLLVL